VLGKYQLLLSIEQVSVISGQGRVDRETFDLDRAEKVNAVHVAQTAKIGCHASARRRGGQ
jgi:hypothetical protein